MSAIIGFFALSATSHLVMNNVGNKDVSSFCMKKKETVEFVPSALPHSSSHAAVIFMSVRKLLAYFACGCCAAGNKKAQSRAEVRAKWKNPRYDQDSDSDSDDDGTEIDELSPDQILAAKKIAATLQLQRIVRGFLGRRAAKQQSNANFQSADDFWLGYYADMLEKERQEKLAALARRKFARQMTNDVISISVLYITQVLRLA